MTYWEREREKKKEDTYFTSLSFCAEYHPTFLGFSLKNLRCFLSAGNRILDVLLDFGEELISQKNGEKQRTLKNSLFQQFAAISSSFCIFLQSLKVAAGQWNFVQRFLDISRDISRHCLSMFRRYGHLQQVGSTKAAFCSKWTISLFQLYTHAFLLLFYYRSSFIIKFIEKYRKNDNSHIFRICCNFA